MERIVIEVDKESFLQLLERLRRERGLSYSDIAKKLRVSPQLVHWLAQGKLKNTLNNKHFAEYVNLLIKNERNK